jgi:hypothetical protein
MRWLNSEASLCKIVAKGFLTFDHRKMNCCAVVAKDSLNRVFGFKHTQASPRQREHAVNRSQRSAALRQPENEVGGRTK